ncbi:hypothetical protein RN001_008349 [Aquatica leii]|uniref:Peptidase M16 C-terminal domain-containing protein n=1 Tax=Aquatica leii TaxID=1421715 RepID=A0AAN7QIY5_9COLE|nr:hypothetical protein RN001_008349 [Aquatica leii]
MPPADSTPDSISSTFELIYCVKAFNKIPVFKFKSKLTGLTVIIAEVDGPVVNGFFAIPTEAFDDDGLPHTLEHLIFLGSELYPYKGVLDLLANRCLASGTNAWTDVDVTCYTMETAGYEGFVSLMPIYLDHILYPILTDEAFITEVHHITGTGEDAGVVYCEMQGCENSAESRLHSALQKKLYPGHCGYSSNTGGKMKNLRESTTNDKVRKYHKEFYRPENLALIISGQIKPEDVFRALEPVENKIIEKGERGPFLRPWQSSCPPVEKSEDLIIKYPSDDETTGLVFVAWRGPSSVTQTYELSSCITLLKYLTDYSVAPLQKEFVEIDDPYACLVSYNVVENSDTSLYLSFGGVPKDKLELIKPKLDSVLKTIVDDINIDMKRIQSIINRQKLENLSSLEHGPHSRVAHLIIGHMLFGNTEEDLRVRLNPSEDLDKMLEEPKEFWVDLLSKWYVNNKVVSVQGVPSAEEQQEMASEEKIRIKKQIEELGEEGLAQKEDELIKAIEFNERAPSDAMLTCVPIPGVSSINFHEVTRYSTDSSNKKHIDLSNTPVFTYFDHLKSSFVYIMALMDTSKVSSELRPFLPLLLETLLESPIERDGEIIPYEDVIAQLQDDAVSTGEGLGLCGLDSGRFYSGSFANTATVILQVEPEKFERGIIWLRELLYQTQFKVERLKIIASKMINEVAHAKRSGSSMVLYLMKALRYRPDCNQQANGVFKQHKFLTKLVERMESEPNEVVNTIEGLRSLITDQSNVSLYFAANLECLKDNPLEVISKFEPPKLSETKKRASLNIIPDWKFLAPGEEQKLSHCIVGMGCLESSEFLQSTASIKAYDDPDMPAVMVYAQYLTQAEGPLWKQIRGKGYAYGYSIVLKVNEGLLHLGFSCATNVVGAYKETADIVLKQIETEVWDPILFESAKCSLIYESIQNEDSVGSVVFHSLQMYFNNVNYEYNRTLLRLIDEVTIEDLNRVGTKYFAPLFDPKKVNTAVVCDPAKADEIASGFKQFDINLNIYSSLEDSFLTQGALLKYLGSATQRGVTEHDIETSVTTSEKCAPFTSGCIVNHEALRNETAAISAQSESWEIEMENSEEIDSLQGEDTGDSTATQAKDEYADESISDIGTWPILIPDNLRTLLVARGYKTVQHLDCKFAECAIIVVFSTIASLNCQRPSNDENGQYIHDISGQYVHDDSGRYIHDHSGDYLPDGQGGYQNDNSGLYRGDANGLRQNDRSFQKQASPIPSVTNVKYEPGRYVDGHWKIIKQAEDIDTDGYHWEYETENGIKAEESGKLANKGTDKESMQAKGFYQYTGPDQTVYSIGYTADENGFRAVGNHLPTPPPIPLEIQKSLEYLKSLGKL